MTRRPAPPPRSSRRLHWRSAEFAYVWRRLSQAPGARILDVGSPKELAAILAYHRGYEVVATDILPEEVSLNRRYAHAQGLDGQGPGRVHSEVQDGRALTYTDNCFDAAYSVSVLEHIPDRGDSAAIRELIRVVRPGGVVVVTVPYDRRYRETFVEGPVYERKPIGSEPVFFERHYDRETLAERLLNSGPAQVVDVSIWGEGSVRMDAFLERLEQPAPPVAASTFTGRRASIDCAAATGQGGWPGTPDGRLLYAEASLAIRISASDRRPSCGLAPAGL